jgi:hypothetical protein
MPKTQVMPEVQILQFFEEAPIEKAETVFNIVSGKMSARLARSDEPLRRKQKRNAVTPRAAEVPGESS